MSLSDSVRQAVLNRDRYCQLFHCEPVPATELAHIRHQGIGGDPETSAVNQPANLIAVCAQCHRKLHGPGIPYQIVRWDPDDHENGLEVIDPEGRRVSRDGLWFYARQQWEQALEDLQWLQGAVRGIRETRWRLGQIFAKLKANGGFRAGGYDDIYQLGHELGLSSAEVKRLIRAAEFAKKMGLDMQAIDPEIADALRRVPEEELHEVANLFALHPLPEAWRQFHDRYGRERQRIFRKFRAVIKEGSPCLVYEEIRMHSEDGVSIQPGEVVVRGGSVIAGIEKEQDDKGEV